VTLNSLDFQIQKNKFYEDYSMNDCVHMILQDIQKNGQSIGWTGKSDSFETLSKKLKIFDVFYVNDAIGTWKKRETIF
jgi:hypothetical protein